MVSRRDQGGRGQLTRRRLLEAGRVLAGQQSFRSLRVDDVAWMAGTSHGAFYLYFASKEDLLAALIDDALRDMDAVVAAFPAVASGPAGREALACWVRRFGRTYARHATAFQRLGSADAGDQNLRCLGLRWRLAAAIAQGMATRAGLPYPQERAELTGLPCAMMLERMNYLLSAGMAIDPRRLADRLTAIIMAAFAGPDR